MPFRSPLHELEQARGARFETCCSREIVQDYGVAREEYEAVRSGVGALDLSYLGRLKVTGRDRVRYLHNMLSNDIKNLHAGTGCYATLLTRQGKMESDLHVYAFPDEIWLECPPAGEGQVRETLDKFIVGDVVQIEDWSQKYTVLSLQGPQAKSRMGRGVDASLDEMPALAHKTVPGSSGAWVIIHRDRTGCDGYDLWLPLEDAPEVWTRWLDSQTIQPVGHQALDWLRTEAGIPWFGIDMKSHHLPMEFRLDSAISMTKGCYRGQEIVTRVTHRGHLDHWLGAVAVSQGELPEHGSEVRANGAKIGEVTSAILSPRLRRPLALALLKKDLIKPGMQVEVMYGGSALTGEVVLLPLS
jgi:folate-binding protein YgfZ